MTLRALLLSVSEGAAAPVREGGYGRCSFCGGRLGSQGGTPTPDAGNAAAECALCLLVRHLDRPRIDDEAELVWLPEMSQPAVNITMREIHLRLRALGESLDAATPPQRDTPERRRLYHARAALRERTGAAAARLGSGHAERTATRTAATLPKRLRTPRQAAGWPPAVAGWALLRWGA